MENKRILIIGGTGSWSNGLIQTLLKENVAQIKVFARSESQIFTLKQQYPDVRIVPVIGDIRDKSRLMEVCKDCDFIFHLAALKHVPICEVMPSEAVLTNVIGTQNMIDCAIANAVPKVVYVSTDKAITPECTYGCTKLLGEKLILAANHVNRDTKFIVFRSGNLLGSSGSVIPIFQKQIESNQSVNLTDKSMTRFFITIPKASELLVESAIRGAGGEIFLPQMPSLWIYDIAKYLLSKNGIDESKIQITGLRPGERLNEALVTEEESKYIYRISDLLYMIAKEDYHSWITNGFIKKEDNYLFRSQDAVVDYNQTAEFLNAADI